MNLTDLGSLVPLFSDSGMQFRSLEGDKDATRHRGRAGASGAARSHQQDSGGGGACDDQNKKELGWLVQMRL